MVTYKRFRSHLGPNSINIYRSEKYFQQKVVEKIGNSVYVKYTFFCKLYAFQISSLSSFPIREHGAGKFLGHVSCGRNRPRQFTGDKLQSTRLSF
jgi:hypothetical protein